MTTIYLALEDGLVVVRGGEAEAHLEGRAPRSLAADPAHPERVWCGTEDAGVWRSDDAGASWRPAGEALAALSVSALAVAPDEDAVYAGIDPTALWRTEDRGALWQAVAALQALPSAPTWSFPPRPETSHVRWITLDPGTADQLAVCIEAGALVRSRDGGRTWTDRVPGGPYDTHVLAAHPDAPGRLYSAAGDGYFESRDGGDTWERPDAGIDRHYLYGLAIDPGDPDTVVVSAAFSPMRAHSPGAADSTVYRRSGGGPWREVRDGLPEPAGSVRALFATSAGEPGTFYAAGNRGLFRSADGGASWRAVLDPLPGGRAGQSPHAILATR